MPYKGEWGYGPDGRWGYQTKYVPPSFSDLPQRSDRKVGPVEAVISWLLFIPGVIFLIYQIAHHH